MYVSRMRVTNWRNFTKADVELGETTFLIGPNACGKSNLLDVFRFMRDLVKPHGGGLQQSMDSRGGMSKVRSLAARTNSRVELDFELRESLESRSGEPDWRYQLSVATEVGGKRRPIVERERVVNKSHALLTRPDEDDRSDPERLTQTALEQINANAGFRAIADFFEQVLYLHLVPQLLKYGQALSPLQEADPFGQRFLEEIARTTTRARDSRLMRIDKILAKVIPNLQDLRFLRDESTGRPHLEMRYKHWRPRAGWQREDQFSDGTLRLIALMWSLLTTSNMILLEEPELSLHKRIVEQIPKLIQQARRSRKKAGGQVVVSTHSEAMLSGQDTAGTYLLLRPGAGGEATEIGSPSTDDVTAMQSGLSPADVLLPQTSTSIGDV